jgi:hypothetical protein
MDHGTEPVPKPADWETYVPPDSESHPPQTGESWESLAQLPKVQALGYLANDLCNFNFRTRDPDEINWYLCHKVGCQESDWDGSNYHFSTGNNDIYLPTTKNVVPVQNLQQAGQQSQQSLPNQPLGAVSGCQQPPKKLYVHLGLRLAVQQYNIGHRTWELTLPQRVLRSGQEAENFHKWGDDQGDLLTTVAQQEAGRVADEKLASQVGDPKLADEVKWKPDPHLIYPIFDEAGPPVVDEYYADLTTKSRLVKEPDAQNYQAIETGNGYFNDVLGSDVAVHVLRSDICEAVPSSGYPDYSQMKRDITDLKPTEKMALRLFTYVKTTVNGTQKIYKIENGLILQSETLDEKTDYPAEIRKARESPVLPGIVRVDVLIVEDTPGVFSLKEVYCDGDCIFPEGFEGYGDWPAGGGSGTAVA